MDNRIHIGTVESVSPGKRRLRIEIPTSYVAYALSISVLECRLKDGSELKCRVATSTKTADGIVAKLVAGVPRDTVAQLKKCRIVASADAIERDSSHYDVDELVGLSVFDANHTRVGKVASGFNTRASAMFELELTDGSTIVLPVVKEIVSEVDWIENRVVLMPGVPLDGVLNNDDDDTVLV